MRLFDYLHEKKFFYFLTVFFAFTLEFFNVVKHHYIDEYATVAARFLNHLFRYSREPMFGSDILVSPCIYRFE